ncbi:MAG: pitrilysin family protein [Chloroflexota bacterium]
MNLSLPNTENITRTVLDNGITVLVYENHAAPVAVLEGRLNVGAVQDPADKTGVSSFTSSMLTRGSASYDFDSFNETIESVGASLGVSSGKHTVSFHSNSLSEDLPTMVTVLADILRNPTFPEPHMELIRNQRLIAIQEREQDTQQVASLHFNAAMYGSEHPYGRTTTGYTDSVNAITRQDLVDFHNTYYSPQGAVIVVVGDVQTQDVLQTIGGSLGDWTGEMIPQDLASVIHPSNAQKQFYAMPDKVQSDIVLGVPAVPRTNPDFDAIRVANSILGQFGMMGRLGEKVREEQGLAYYSYSACDTRKIAGSWNAIAGVNPANVDQAIESIRNEFARMADTPVDASELSDTQAYMTGIMPLALETNAGIAGNILTMEWEQLGLDYLERYSGVINGITVADVQRVAKQYLNADNYVQVVAGPESE